MTTSPLQTIINDLAEQLRPGIAEIEKSPAITRGHYDVYMGIISKHAADAGQAKVLSAAMIKAGANAQGVTDAQRLCYPG